ncbi:hypothetical protein GCM10025874_26410 [Arenivirga flava]|uniref:Uncharacterized protein n=1 Tax=Arenivirga flava TaxID=1930060 RepID=A0AA37UF87_9MICO|nr:hypothetical protein GCM10025874_26410 [Arenivirga flava]
MPQLAGLLAHLGATVSAAAPVALAGIAVAHSYLEFLLLRGAGGKEGWGSPAAQDNPGMVVAEAWESTGPSSGTHREPFADGWWAKPFRAGAILSTSGRRRPR